ncbi:hypothetical protein [uncultured Draconibacterium sp.]|uniref:hypothetical protein n=1 Tax=uncultured Draconibacterium sp. TaxID=1573823 RepID=UPI0032163D3D
MKSKIFVFLFLLISTNLCFAQSGTLNVDFSSENWKTFGAAAVQEFESEVSTSVSDGVGIAYLDGVNFQNGVIECDLYSPSPKAYLGIAFRIGSLTNFECIYFQPHTSGKRDAVQYDPIFNMSATWQLYNGESYQAVADIPTKKWFHVKIELKGDFAKVYLHNNPVEALTVKLKHDLHPGNVGVYSYHPAIFKNLKITKSGLMDTFIEQPETSSINETYISSWLISEPYDNYDFKIEKPFLNDNLITGFREIETEENYLMNLNRHFTKSKAKNTVLAKVYLNSNKAQTKNFHFGYSDRIKVYLNSNEVFRGENDFRDSENYEDRGYVSDKQETIELPLLKGENELLLEIAEEKFGWGFIARFEDLEGIEIKKPNRDK